MSNVEWRMKNEEMALAWRTEAHSSFFILHSTFDISVLRAIDDALTTESIPHSAFRIPHCL
jgi:hypothetical protein